MKDIEYSVVTIEDNKTKDYLHKHYVISRRLLEKDVFTKTEENRKRIHELGFIKIGEVHVVDYDADMEMAFITLHQITTDNLKYEYIFEGLTIQVKVNRNEAKNLFQKKQEYDLLAKIDYLNDIIIINDLIFHSYHLLNILEDFKPKEDPLKNLDTSKVWRDSKTNFIWLIESFNKQFTYDEALKKIAKLNKEQYAGCNNWRLPTLKELIALKSKKKSKNDDNSNLLKLDTLKILSLKSNQDERNLCKYWTISKSNRFLYKSYYVNLCNDKYTLGNHTDNYSVLCIMDEEIKREDNRDNLFKKITKLFN